MAATTLSSTEYKTNVPNSNFKNKIINQIISFDLLKYIALREQKTEPETPALTGNWLIGISPNDPPHFLGSNGRRMILTFAVWPHGKYLPNPKIWKSSRPEPMNHECWSALRQGWFYVSSGHTMMSHLGVFLCLWGIVFMFHVCLCGVLCARTQFFTKGKFLPWSLKPEVQCLLLFEIVSFVWNNTGDNPELVLCMDHGWKTGDYINSRPTEITTITPYFWLCCLWHPDEEGNSSDDGGKGLHCWKKR